MSLNLCCDKENPSPPGSRQAGESNLQSSPERGSPSLGGSNTFPPRFLHGGVERERPAFVPQALRRVRRSFSGGGSGGTGPRERASRGSGRASLTCVPARCFKGGRGSDKRRWRHDACSGRSWPLPNHAKLPPEGGSYAATWRSSQKTLGPAVSRTPGKSAWLPASAGRPTLSRC